MMKRRVQIALAFSGGAVAFVGEFDASGLISVFCVGSAMVALSVCRWSWFCWCLEVVILVAEGLTLRVDVWGCGFGFGKLAGRLVECNVSKGGVSSLSA
jgi:hypothetical protein